MSNNSKTDVGQIPKIRRIFMYVYGKNIPGLSLTQVSGYLAALAQIYSGRSLK